MKKLITLLCLIAQVGFSQSIPKEPIGKFMRDGVVYWHKDLAYYVFIDSDSTGAGTDLLHSKHQAKYSNPSYFDTYGWNYIRTKWAVDKTTHIKAVPEQEITWEVYVDGEPPVTTTSFLSKSAYLVKGVRYFASDLMMELQSKDKDAGVRHIYYSMNNQDYVLYEQPIKLNPKDTFSVKYFSVDNVGNFEKVRNFAYAADDYNIKYAVDANAPETELMTTFKNNRYVGVNTEFVFKSKDKGSGVAYTYYSIDNDSLHTYVGPFTATFHGLKLGWHTIKWYSVDWVTNKEREQSKKFFLELAVPEVYISAKGAYFSKDSIMFVSDTTQIKIEASTPMGVKGIAYKFTDDKAYQRYDRPIMLPHQYKARQDLRYFVQDSIDNESGIYVLKLERDRSKPNVAFMLTGVSFVRGDTTFVTSQTKHGTFNYDTLSGIGKDHMIVNGKRVKAVDFSKPGVYDVMDSVWDNVGNINTLRRIYRCDTSAPNIEFHFSNTMHNNSVYPVGMILFLAIDDETGIKSYKTVINGKEFVGTNFQGRPGSYKVEVTAIDHLGQSATKSVEFQIK